jgi:hypothetical protein
VDFRLWQTGGRGRLQSQGRARPAAMPSGGIAPAAPHNQVSVHVGGDGGEREGGSEELRL